MEAIKRWRSVCKHSSPGFLGFGPGGSCQAEARWARLSLPLSIRAGQWRWGRWRGRGRGRCRGLRGRGLRERRHRNTSADSETKSSPGRQPLGTPLDGRMPLQVWMGGVGIGNQTAVDRVGGGGGAVLAPLHTKLLQGQLEIISSHSFTAQYMYESSADVDRSAVAACHVCVFYLCVFIVLFVQL